VDPMDSTGMVYVAGCTTRAGPGQIFGFARPNPNGAAPTVVVSGFTCPGAMNFDSNGNLFVADGINVYEVRHPITSASVPQLLFSDPLGGNCVALDASNNLYRVTTDSSSANSLLKAYAPPYNGAPVVVSIPSSTNGNLDINDCAYDKGANSLFSAYMAQTVVVGWALPLTPHESPSAEIRVGQFSSLWNRL
jgi:hypothetical protein